MHNVVRVTEHLCARHAGEKDAERRRLRLVSTRAGDAWLVDDEGDFWRTYLFVEGSHALDSARRPEDGYQAARAFGGFLADLADLPGTDLVETIAGFHDLDARMQALTRAARTDAFGRLPDARAELARAEALHARVARILGGADPLPRRVVHNDCKLNNVLLDDITGRGLCVIDLDTVMEGTVLCDFGDLVRSAASSSPEDERDLDNIRFELDRFEALTRGYLDGVGAQLSRPERAALALAGPRMTLETGVRFLTDHLEGDVYFRTGRSAHNLDRCRCQLTLAERMLDALAAARRIVDAAG